MEFSVFIGNPDLKTVLLSASVVIAGSILFLDIRGVIVDFNQKMIYYYFSLILFRIHFKKVDIEGFENVDLILFSENQTMAVIPHSTTVRTKVYEIRLTNSEKKEVLIAETTDYQKAISLMNEIADRLNLKARNRYADWLKEVKNRRK